MVRTVTRALRHGLVVAGVCLAIAFVTGLGGYAFADESLPGEQRAAPPRREGAATSLEVLGRWLRPSRPAAPTVAEAGAPEPRVAVLAPLASEPADAALVVVAAPQVLSSAELRVRAQRLEVTPLAPGDRPVVGISFYYCEEAAGGYARGDGGGFCGRARDGSSVRSGVAACDPAYLGQRFRIEGDPTGRTYVCADTGSAVRGMHRDIWFLDNRDGWLWQRAVGKAAVIEVVP